MKMLTPKFEPGNKVMQIHTKVIYEVLSACIYKNGIRYDLVDKSQNIVKSHEQYLSIAPEQEKQMTLAEVAFNSWADLTGHNVKFDDLPKGDKRNYAFFAKAVETEVRHRLANVAGICGTLDYNQILNTDIGE